MQKIYFINYSDEKYESQQANLNAIAEASGQFDVILPWTRKDIVESDFYTKNKELLDAMPIGDDGRVKPGFFLWKVFIISETLKRMNYNDVLMYIDCGDALYNTEGLRDFLLKKTKNIEVILTDGAFKNSAYTKRDAFVLMNCDNERYHNAIQVEAGIFVCKKGQFSNYIVRTWLKYCCDRRIISDDPNVCGKENLPDFVAIRWEQSCLGLLRIKNDIYSSGEMREFVTCNACD